MIIPALLAKKTNAPVMMRISREEETFIGRARPSFQGRMKVGFSKEGQITASTCSSFATTVLMTRWAMRRRQAASCLCYTSRKPCAGVG